MSGGRRSVFWKKSSWMVTCSLAVYIYLTALYVLYTNQQCLDKYVVGGPSDVDQHPVHEHAGGAAVVRERRDLPSALGFASPSELVAFRQRRYEKAQARRPDVEGPGEGGVAVMLTPEEQKEADRLFPNETFNVVASNKMAMDRRIRDLRHPE